METGHQILETGCQPVKPWEGFLCQVVVKAFVMESLRLKNMQQGSGEMRQPLRVPVVLLEDQDSVPRPHQVVQNDL